MEYIDGMVKWDFRDLKTIRVKQVLRVAAEIEGRAGAKHLRTRKEINRNKSGEDYLRRVLEFLRKERESERTKKEEDNEFSRIILFYLRSLKIGAKRNKNNGFVIRYLKFYEAKNRFDK